MEKLIFGTVNLYRIFCDFCNDFALVNSKDKTCPDCGTKLNQENIDKIRILSNKKRTDKLGSKKLKKNLIKKQNNKCYWCSREFGDFIIKNDKAIKLKFNFEHKLPFSYTHNNDIQNIVGSCHICNGFKSGKIFESEEDCKIYLERRWNMAILDNKIIEP